MAPKGLEIVLAQVMKAGAPHLDFKKPSIKGFETLVDSFGAAATPPKKDVRKAFGASLVPIGMDKSGGMYAEWNPRSGERPIVYFGTEGNAMVAARDMREFLAELAFSVGDGWGLRDAMKYWRTELTALDDELEHLPTAPAADACAEVDRRIIEVLEANDIPLVDDLLAAVEAANRKFLWALISAIDVQVSGYETYKLWFEAWNEGKGAIRTFSPKERFEPGDRVRYTLKSAEGETQGRGLVLGHPAPNRVLIADQQVTFVRAYAE